MKPVCTCNNCSSTRETPKRHTTREKHSKLLELAASGLPYTTIGKRLGMRFSTVGDCARANGIRRGAR